MERALDQFDRPKSVVLFEAISILSAVAGMLLSDGESPFGELAQLLLIVGLTLWVTRGRSPLGRLIYTGVLLLGELILVVVYIQGYVPRDMTSTLLLSVSLVMGLMLLTLLWWPPTTTWLKSRPRRV